MQSQRPIKKNAQMERFAKGCSYKYFERHSFSVTINTTININKVITKKCEGWGDFSLGMEGKRKGKVTVLKLTITISCAVCSRASESTAQHILC